MSILAVLDAKIYVGGYDLSGYSNEINLSITPDLLDGTTFGTGTKKNVPGLLSVKGVVKGFMDHADFPGPGVDAGTSLNSLTFAKIGETSSVFSTAPVGNAEGETAYGMPSVSGSVPPLSGAVGALMPWELDINNTGIKMFRAQVAALGVKTATGQTTAAIQIVGGVPNAQRKLFANLHVVTADGTTPTLDVVVESDDNSGFTTPTTRLTFTQVTDAVAAEHKSVAGPIADEYYRMKWTISGAGAEYTVFGILGIA